MQRRILALHLIALTTLTPVVAQANPAWDGVHVEAGQDNAILSLSAFDGSHGWALAVRNTGGNSELLGLRTDNGDSWQQMSLPPSGNPMLPTFFTAILRVDAQTGYLAGMDLPTNKIWRTTDGGSTWTEVTQTGASVKQFQSLPSGDVFALTGDEVLHSADGVTWTSAPVPSPGGDVSAQGLHMLNPTCGWIVGGWGFDEDNHPTPSDGAVWTTTDGGQTWTLLGQALPWYLHRVHFVAGNLGFAVGSAGEDGVLVRTEDGGQTWTEQSLPDHPAMPDVCVGTMCIDEPTAISDMQAVRFFDANRGVALGLACTSPPCDRGDNSATYLTSFLRTYDGGQTWAHDEHYEDAMPDIDMRFMTVPGELAKQIVMDFPDPNHGFLGGQHNMILRYEASQPESPEENTMPGCDSNANTNGSTNSNSPWDNSPGGDSGCGCQAHPAPVVPLLLLLVGGLLIGLRMRRRRR